MSRPRSRSLDLLVAYHPKLISYLDVSGKPFNWGYAACVLPPCKEIRHSIIACVINGICSRTYTESVPYKANAILF